MTAATWPKYADTSGVQQITQDMRDNQKRFRPDDVQRLQALIDTDQAFISYTDTEGTVHVEPSMQLLDLIARVSLNPETP
jgi:pyridoxine 5'-phosphate synthase PdxJ